MDISNIFKACVKTLKARHKALGIYSNNDKLELKSSILKQTKQKGEFSVKSKDLVKNISKLRDFIVEHQKAYINVDFLSDSSGMNDIERDQIDADAQIIIKTCSQIIRDFKREVLLQTGTAQEREHKQAVLQLIEEYLKGICLMISEQKAIRIKRTIDKQKMFQLSLTGENSRTAFLKEKIITVNVPNGASDLIHSLPDATVSDFEDDAPTAEEIQMFEQENQRLYDELSTVADEVRHIEGQVMEISKLQDIFTSKILQQDHDLDRVADTVVHTTENIKSANEDIRDAMKKNASFRAWLLFFLIVMAFSLLFLDWYNP